MHVELSRTHTPIYVQVIVSAECYSLLFLEFRSTTDGKRSSDVARPQTNSSSHEPVQRRRLLPREVWYAVVSLQCLSLSSPQRGMVCCRITAVPSSFFSPERYGMLSYHCSAPLFLLPREVWYAVVSLQCLALSSPQRGMVCCRITAVPSSFFSPERYGMLSYHCSA